ncbi:alpha/beta fold hydrolase [Nocardia sp. NPDC004278]
MSRSEPMIAATGDHIITVFGQRIRVRTRPGRGIPLVLCNGIGAGLEVLAPIVDGLDLEIPVVSFDVPGTGESPHSPLPYGFPYLAWLLGRILDKLGIDRVDLLGLSWGGAVAQQFAFQNPRRCRRLVLVSAATGVLMVPAHPRVLVKMATPRRFRDPEYATDIAAASYGGTARTDPERVAELFHRQVHAGSLRGYLYQLLAGSLWTSLPALWAIRQPTLIVAGTDDPIIPVVNARIMHRMLPHSTLHLHPGGHVDVVTDAATFGPVISGFLRSARARPRPTRAPTAGDRYRIDDERRAPRI